jgi:site-specific recombinase XerD
MLKQLFPKYHTRYTESSASPWLQSFAEWLVAEGYAYHPARGHVRRLKQTLEQASRPTPIDSSFTSDELTVLFACPDESTILKATECAFRRFLRAKNRLIEEKQSSPFGELLCNYRTYLTEVRGFKATTISQHLSTIERFLSEALPPNSPLDSISPQIVEAFIVVTSQRMIRQSLQHIVAHLRSFLRFCYDQKALPRRLNTIDSPRTYRGELPPRALAWGHVLGLLRSIDRSRMSGCRDHAMLYLMAHYGLRPSEIAALRVDSIDWISRTLRVEQSKTRSTLVLPLSDQALRVIKRYLRCGRPGNARPELFLRQRSPVGPVTHYTVGDVYTKRARDSGQPLQGTSSYCLRHAFAMRLLTRGVGIKTIGDLLGHRTLESTCVYLRLQTETLREVALPVPYDGNRGQL